MNFEGFRFNASKNRLFGNKITSATKKPAGGSSKSAPVQMKQVRFASQPVENSKPTPTLQSGPKEESAYDELKKSAQQLMMKQLAEAKNYSHLETKIKRKDEEINSQKAKIQKLTIEASNLTSTLACEKEKYSKITFDLLASQTLFSSLKETLGKTTLSIVQGKQDYRDICQRIKAMISFEEEFSVAFELKSQEYLASGESLKQATMDISKLSSELTHIQKQLTESEVKLEKSVNSYTELEKEHYFEKRMNAEKLAKLNESAERYLASCEELKITIATKIQEFNGLEKEFFVLREASIQELAEMKQHSIKLMSKVEEMKYANQLLDERTKEEAKSAKEASDRMSEQVKDLQAHISGKNESIKVKEEEIVDAKEKQEKLLEALKDQENEMKEMKKEKEKLVMKISSLETAQNMLIKDNAHMNESMRIEREQLVSDLLVTKTEKETISFSLSQAQEMHSSRMAQQADEKSRLELEIEAIQRKMIKKEEDRESTESSLRHAEQQNSELQKEKENLFKALESLKGEEEASKVNKGEMEGKMACLKAKYEKKEAELVSSHKEMLATKLKECEEKVRKEYEEKLESVNGREEKKQEEVEELANKVKDFQTTIQTQVSELAKNKVTIDSLKKSMATELAKMAQQQMQPVPSFSAPEPVKKTPRTPRATGVRKKRDPSSAPPKKRKHKKEDLQTAFHDALPGGLKQTSSPVATKSTRNRTQKYPASDLFEDIFGFPE